MRFTGSMRRRALTTLAGAALLGSIVALGAAPAQAGPIPWAHGNPGGDSTQSWFWPVGFGG